MDRLAPAMPLVALCLALGVAGSWPLAAVILVGTLALAVVGPRWEVDRGRQLVLCVMGGVVGYSVVSLMYEPTGAQLGDGWAKIAASLTLATAARFVQIGAFGGRPVTVGMGYLAMLAVGEVRGKGVYPACAALFLLASLWSLAEGDPGRSRATVARRLALGALVLALAGGMSVSAAVGTRLAHAYAMRKARSTTLSWQAQTGFSDRMDLGSLDGLLDSDTVVLRVRGARVDYLRGSVFDVYEGRWVRSEKLGTDVAQSFALDVNADERRMVEISAVSDRTDRFFLPLEAGSFALSPAAVKVDGFGAVKRATKGLVAARVTLGPRTDTAPSPPTPFDRFLTRRTRAQLTPLVHEWVAGAATPEEQLDAIERRFARDFRYSRSSNHGHANDPTLDFLFGDRRGHCEYFASGMVLMARAAGIPARMVAGYRVAEESPLSGYRVVREANAHAWVEAWVEGKGWVTRDPTPAEAVPQNRPHASGYAAALTDLLRLQYGKFTDWVANRSLTEVSLASLAGVLVLGVIVARGARSRRAAAAAAPPDERPPASLAELLDALERRGFARAAHETIEQLAERVPDPTVSALLLRFAALRYGGEGDAATLDRDAIDAARSPTLVLDALTPLDEHADDEPHHPGTRPRGRAHEPPRSTTDAT